MDYTAYLYCFCLSLQAQSKHNIELIWDHQVVDTLAEGFDTHYGARSIKYEVSCIRGNTEWSFLILFFFFFFI